MKKKLFLLFALLAFIAAACTRDNLLPENNGKDATQENPEEQTQGYQDPTILMFTLEVLLLHSAPLWMMNKALKALLSELPSAGSRVMPYPFFGMAAEP